jgi:hypothetical protein
LDAGIPARPATANVTVAPAAGLAPEYPMALRVSRRRAGTARGTNADDGPTEAGAVVGVTVSADPPVELLASLTPSMLEAA